MKSSLMGCMISSSSEGSKKGVGRERERDESLLGTVVFAEVGVMEREPDVGVSHAVDGKPLKLRV